MRKSFLFISSNGSRESSIKVIQGCLEQDIVECGEFNRVQENAFVFYETME